MLISVIQMLWDRGEGNGYANHMTDDPLPGTPATEVLLQPRLRRPPGGQVAADVQARTYGAATNDPPLVDGPLARRRAAVGHRAHRDLAARRLGHHLLGQRHADRRRYENVPAAAADYGEDPHGDPRNDPDARVQISEFLKPGGVVVDVCGGDPCLVDFE